LDKNERGTGNGKKKIQTQRAPVEDITIKDLIPKRPEEKVSGRVRVGLGGSESEGKRLGKRNAERREVKRSSAGKKTTCSLLKVNSSK